jgi:hypothetical protein
MVALLKDAATGRVERCPQRPAGEWGPSRDLKIVLEGDEPAP